MLTIQFCTNIGYANMDGELDLDADSEPCPTSFIVIELVSRI